jgi:peptide/nickel transport system substrate-binding protein
LELVPTVTQFFTTDGIVKGAAFRNATGYSSPEMDGIVAKLAVETAPDARRALAAEFAKLASTDVPLVPLVEIQAFTLAGKKVRNFTTSANVQGETLADVWLQP